MIVRLKQTRRDRSLARSARLNQRRCDVTSCPLSSNLIDKVESITACNGRHSVKKCFSSWQERTRQFDPLAMSVLDDVIKSPMQRLEEMRDILERYVFLVPKVLTPTAKLKIGHQPAWKEYSLKLNMTKLRRWLVDQSFPLRRVMQNQTLQFPEARLIQYDCGKLQVLSVLLRQFWAGKHRILIFTQMTRVLDILEAFLNYHGYRYLRLDGSTAIEQRMSRMERFNNDPRIFCFILSTRSGGIGVNLTGADTVVFYDSDWNPTMDAQAQDRCHRIGQTRDVHIYRLISDRTIEENILKKANQKRLLGDLAIEGGSFTTAFFKSQAIKDIFDEPSGLEELTESSASQQPATSRPLTARQKALEAAKTKEVAGGEEAAHVESNEKAELERALLESEDKEDAAAATLLKEEQNAVLEEFTEEERGISEAGSMQDKSRGGTSRVEEELLSIYNELNPIEQYALKFLELSADQVIDLQLQQAEAQVERSKKDWELTHLVALKEEEERRLEDEEDEIFYTREDQPEIEVRKRKGGKKRKRKDRDICFLDMSSSDSDETYRDEVELMEYDEADRRDVDDDEERRDVEDEVERPDVDDEERRDDDNKKEDEVEVAEQVKPLHLPPKRVKRDTTRGTARRGRGRSSTGLGRNMRGRGRGGGPVVVGRGRRGRGARAVPTQARLPSSSSSSSEDDASQPKPAQPPKARENPLWIEYGEELADYLRDDDDERQWSDNSLLTSSNDDHLLTDDDDGAEPRRQQTVIRDADRTEKLLQSAQRRQLDFGPCEIMSFSKSGRARKRNSRFCDDEYEVFGPGTAATIPRASPRPSLEHQSVYNVVVETPLRSQPPPCNPQPATHKPMRKQATVQQQQRHQTSVQNRNVFSAFSVLDSGGKLHNLPKVVQPPAPQRLAPATAPITFRHVAQPQQLSVIRLAHVGSQNVMVTQALQQAPHARPQSIFIQQGANMPLQQIRIIGANSLTHNSPRQLPPGPALLQPPPAPPAAQRKSHGGASRKPWSGNTRVVDCHNMMEGSGKASLFDALQEEMGSEDDELMVTLDMEPVSCLDDNGNDQFLAPENEEERNVFESFQSLLQS